MFGGRTDLIIGTCRYRNGLTWILGFGYFSEKVSWPSFSLRCSPPLLALVL